MAGVANLKTSMKVDELLQQVVAQTSRAVLSDTKMRKNKGKHSHDSTDRVLESLRDGTKLDSLHKDDDHTMSKNIYDPAIIGNIKKSSKEGSDDIDEKGNYNNVIITEVKRKKKLKNVDKKSDLVHVKQDEIDYENLPVPGKAKEKPKSNILQPIVKISQCPELCNSESVKIPKKKKAHKKHASDASELQNTNIQSTGSTSNLHNVRQENRPSNTNVNMETQSVSLRQENENLMSENIVCLEKVAQPSIGELGASSVSRRKIKMKDKRKLDDQTNNMKLDIVAEDGVAEDKLTDHTDNKTETKTRRKVRRKKRNGDSTTIAEDQLVQDEKVIPHDDGRVLAITIHRTDKLKNDFNILHPVICIHIIDEHSGNYLTKQSQSTLPMWEELIVFNESFNYFVKTSPKALILFELQDFVNIHETTTSRCNNGWHHIAWAFLKIVGANSIVNVGSKIRLQLYEVPMHGCSSSEQPEVYKWWKMARRNPYPSTLLVTVKSTTPPINVDTSTRSMFPTQREEGIMSYQDLKRSVDCDPESKEIQTLPTNTWSRLFGQLCRIPNKLYLSLPSSKKGCFIVRFSHNGRSLACGCRSQDGYHILIYEIPSGTLKQEIAGHLSLVYDICWSRRDEHLLTASADGTVRLWWKVLNDDGPTESVLPHPGFVYCCKFHPRFDGVIVTGGFDQVLRVWEVSCGCNGGQLRQEIEDHHGYINSICFDDDDDGLKMYSADSAGVINVWNVFVTSQPDGRAIIRDWTLDQSLCDAGLKNVCINHIKMHPSGRRLLVHCRDNRIRMLDLRVQRIMQQYIGAINFRERLGSCITPCGSFIFAGSEDAFVYVWNTDTGDQVACYTDLNYTKPVTDVCYHPRDHMIAVCSLGENQPIYIFRYDPCSDQVACYTDLNYTKPVTDVCYHPRDHMIAVCSLGENQPIYIFRYDPCTAQLHAILPSPRGPDENANIDERGLNSSPKNRNDVLFGTSNVMSNDEFEIQEKHRLNRVMKRLDTATMNISKVPGMKVVDVSPKLDSYPRSGATSSCGNLSDSGSYTATPRTGMPEPGTMSPHSPRSLFSTIQQEQFSSRNCYMKATDSRWRPSFSEVGVQGKSKSLAYHGRVPNISLSTAQGKAQFTFQSPIGCTKKSKKVTALYDYRAQRSDELSLVAGDPVVVLHEDGDHWWMGEMSDGQQGYFPANYVMLADDNHNSLEKSYTAVNTKNDELGILAGGEEEESFCVVKTPARLQRSSEFEGKMSLILMAVYTYIGFARSVSALTCHSWQLMELRNGSCTCVHQGHHPYGVFAPLYPLQHSDTGSFYVFLLSVTVSFLVLFNQANSHLTRRDLYITPSDTDQTWEMESSTSH